MVQLEYSQLWVAVVGTFLVIIGLYLNWRATVAATRAASTSIQQFEHSRLATERQLRAYITLEDSRLHPLAVGVRPTADVIITNSGVTPAFRVGAFYSIAYREVPLKIPLGGLPPDKPIGQSTMGPGGKLVLHTEKVDALAPDQLEAIKSGRAAIFVFGEISYQDIFGVSRTTTFCRYSTEMRGLISNALHAWTEGEDAT